MRRQMLEHRRKKIRKIARDAWIKSGGNMPYAERLVREQAGQLGSALTLLVIMNLVIQICYNLWRFWRDSQVLTPPIVPDLDEPFL